MKGPVRQGQQGGFILLMVLGILVVLVLLASAAATTANRVRADQQRDDTRLAGELAARSTQATLLYLLATQRRTFAGLTVNNRIVYSESERFEAKQSEEVHTLMPVGNELRMDGAVYAGLGTSRFALKADNGLLNPNLEPAMLQAWLEHLKAGPNEQAHLVATLLDYQDPDNFPRLNGAEADQYREAGRPPPPNRTLLTPLELRRVMGWDKLLAPIGDEALMNTLTVARTGPLDVNAAPATVLELLPGVTRQMADRVVALRDVAAFTELAPVYALLPTVPEASDAIGLFPTGSGTMEFWPDPASGGTLIHWTLTPFDDGGSPWHIDYAIRVPASAGRIDAPPREPQTPLLLDAPAAHAGQADAAQGSGPAG